MHKSSWKDIDKESLILRAFEELMELRSAVRNNKSFEAIRREAADVANFCMMVVDVTENSKTESVEAHKIVPNTEHDSILWKRDGLQPSV